MDSQSEKKPSFLKFVFMTIFQGFLLGIGLCAVFAIYHGFERRAAADEFRGSGLESFDFGNDKLELGKDYRLDDVRKVDEGGSVRIVGSITNLHGERALQGVELQANLFKGDAFVDQYTESVSLRPAETRLFKIDCGCRGNPPATHDRHEVILVRSY